MFKTLAAAAVVAGSLAAAVQAAETTSSAPGPVVLDQQQLDQVSAGNGGVAFNAFWQAHYTLANNSGALPYPAQKAIWLLHCLCFVAD